MLSSLPAAYALVRLLTLGEPVAVARYDAPAARADSSAESMILEEMRAFYRDLEDRNWAPLLNHFLPSKVTARWVPPRDGTAWAHLEAPSPVADGVARTSGRCTPRAAVAIVGDWARVRARRCGASVDEAWLLRVSGRWKIVYLDLAPTPQLSTAQP